MAACSKCGDKLYASEYIYMGEYVFERYETKIPNKNPRKSLWEET
jgi:hypothetical protein